MSNLDNDNEIVEINSDEEENRDKLETLEEVELLDDNPSKEKANLTNKKEKKKFKLTKKNKIILIISGVILFLIIVGIVLYFVVFKKDKNPNVPKEKDVILEKDNYRYENGKLVFLDKSEKEIGSYDCENKETEKCLVVKIDYSTDKFERIKNIKENNEEIEKNSQIYYDNYVFIQDGEKLFLYNMNKKKKELDELASIKTYSTADNLIVVENESHKFGLIKITEDGFEYLIRCSYDNLGIVNPKLNYLVAEDKDATYIIDMNGKTLSKKISADIQSVNEKYIVVKINNTYNLYDYNNTELVSDYDYISLNDNLIALVKSNRLYLIDDELNKLYEDGLRLESNDYIKAYVYDSNNKLIETKKAYEIEIKNNIANITIGKTSKEINILEGKANIKYNYMSYYDGKLYFYRDLNKDELIATYTCNNKNKITSADSELENCTIYKNDHGISGIYNDTYVFIYDNDAKSNNYYLYDLASKKTKGTYSSLQIIKANELNSNIKQLYTSSSHIIAMAATGNNKGNYGVLEINSDKVTGIIEFKYKSIEAIAKGYLLTSLDDKKVIYNGEFEKLSNEFDYIKLFDNYYAGVISNKLNVYSYENALGILKDGDITISNNDFNIDFTNGFKITVDNNVYEYDKNGKKITNKDNEEKTDSLGEENGE